MDSKRVLSSTLISVTAITALGTPALAETEARPPIQVRTWLTPAVPQTPSRLPVKTRTWTTSAQPKLASISPANRNKKIALGHVVRRSWNYREFRCLDNLWTRESGWNHRAHNRSSGAYGIPQALPAGKMSVSGRDWRSNPETQIRWGLAYIKGRYGRPCGAWGHFRSHNWY
ncbi:Transglycosylase SLT domain-containing protein [Nonomuraea maritima]|uniref:Transglycosylase SLT domain-containing protein n=1 Tax=Nonomuraea maritima TaxID=683260 RepID=A0A1G9FVG2_9ACTN|nr:transglycosylase SLT domain-containing protein [Nonomuraea maritima]SDK92143.1 Transglycosylase SLT domain-containing protein [Nonomuraea maritima]